MILEIKITVRYKILIEKRYFPLNFTLQIHINVMTLDININI